MSRPPRGQHHQLLPGMPRHLPHETAHYRAEEGCWCAVSYYACQVLPTARQWRAQRRRAVRAQRRWDLIDKRHGIPPQHNHARTLGDPEPVAVGGWGCWWLPCPDGCPAKDFVYARDWPPTVTSWKGLLR